jgi:hypothetical protein
MKRLLMFSYPFPPNASAGAVRSERFARYLPEFGWEVDVVTIKVRRDLFEDTTRVQKLGPSVRIHVTATLDPYLLLHAWEPSWLPMRVVRSAGLRLFSFVDHMLLWIPFAVNRSLQLHRSARFDAVYTTSPPHSTHLAGLIFSRLTKVPVITDFRDPWTLNSYCNMFRNSSLWERIQFRVETAMERAVLNGAAAILANTRVNRDRMLEAFHFVDRQRVFYLPNGWEPFEQPIQTQTDGAPFLIVHAGTFYPKFKPFALLHALSQWKHGTAAEIAPALGDIKVILLGCRDRKAVDMVADLGLQEIVEIRPWVALGEARALMCRADLLWTTLGTGKESASYVPSKIYEYIAAGRPIIGFFPDGEAADLIRETGAGIVFNSDDPIPVIRAIHEAIAAKSSGASFPPFYAPNTAIIEHRRIDLIVKQFANVLNDVASLPLRQSGRR